MSLLKPINKIVDYRCSVCGTYLGDRRSSSKTTCGKGKCLAAYHKMRCEDRKEQDAPRLRRYHSMLARATRLRHLITPTPGIQRPETYCVIITPANEHPLVPLPRENRYHFVKRLIQLVETTLTDGWREPKPLDAFQPQTQILEAACANCGGKCCLRGGTRAHLDQDAIYRTVQLHPKADTRLIISAYCSYLPIETYSGSCVFHAANGCSLPRVMRSNVCLNTICGSIVEIQQRMELDGEYRFFLAASNRTRTVRGRFEVSAALDHPAGHGP